MSGKCDRIFINDLSVRGIVGIHPWERTMPQEILVNVELAVDLRSCAKSDRIDETVNYRTLSKSIITHLETVKRHTVEALAQDIVDLCFKFDQVTRAKVKVEKPGALRHAQSVGVEIERSK